MLGVVVVVMGLLWIVGNSESFTKCVDDAQRAHHGYAVPKRPSVLGIQFVWSFHCVGVVLREGEPIIVALATVGLFLVTGVLAFYTFGLWREARNAAERQAEAMGNQLRVMSAQQTAMEWQAALADGHLAVMREQLTAMKGQETQLAQTVEQMRDTAERQLRAYVFVERVAPPKRGVTPIFFRLTIKNSGQTPAHDVIVRANTALALTTLPTAVIDTEGGGIGPARTTASKTIIPAGAKIYQKVESLPLTPGKIAAIDAGSHVIYVFGRIDYRDAFKKDRWSKFQYAVPKTGGEPEASEYGNEAD